MKRKERKSITSRTGRDSVLLEGSSSPLRDGRGLKQAKPQSSLSARGKGNFLSPTDRARVHPGNTTRKNPSPFPLLQEAKHYKHLFLSLSASLGLREGAVSQLQAGSWQSTLPAALKHMHRAPTATDGAPLLDQREGGSGFMNQSENYSISFDLRVFPLALARAGFPLAAQAG